MNNIGSILPNKPKPPPYNVLTTEGGTNTAKFVSGLSPNHTDNLSQISGNVLRKQFAMNQNLANRNEQIINFAISLTDRIRQATNFVKISLSAFDALFADGLYEMSTLNSSFGNLVKFTKVASACDLAASVSNSMACAVSWLDKAAQSARLTHLEKELNGNPDSKRKAELQYKIDETRAKVDEGNTSLAFSTLASVSYLVGSVTNIATKVPGWISPAFGSLLFGVFYASAKIADLKEDFKEAERINSEIQNYREKADQVDSPSKEIYLMKAAALENYLKKYNKWRVVEHTLDVIVGVCAAFSGVVSLAGPGAASFGSIPLAVSLLASMSFKVGILGYQNLKDKQSRAKAKLAIQLAVYSLYCSFPGTSSKRKNKLKKIEDNYQEAKAKELTKDDNPTGKIQTFINNNDCTGDLKKEIAKSLGLFNESGEPDLGSVDNSHVTKWLINT